MLLILISGHNGGTGATPQTSVKYVGIPWEMGGTAPPLTSITTAPMDKPLDLHLLREIA